MADAQTLTTGSGVNEVDISLKEHQKTERLCLSDRDLQTVRSEINEEQTRLKVIEKRDGSVRLKATEHVGIVSLPDAGTIEIRPKADQTDLLGLLRYAYGVTASTVDQPTAMTAGRKFIEALAALYTAELDVALDQGLHRDYRRTSETVPHLRGRLDVQRQLQRQGPTPTEFECTFDELTADTTVNRGVLYATALLSRLVRDRALSQALDRHHQRLRRRVTLTPIRAIELEGIELTRLASHYTDLFRLTKLVLRSVYIEELSAGGRASFALLVDMNGVFEKVVERGVREAVADRRGWTVEDQASSQSLVTGGKRTFTIRPDVLVRDGDGLPVLVGDAKWKLDDPDNSDREPSNGDIYQLIAYELAHDVPGVLFYPYQGDRVSSQYTVHGLHNLQTVEVPVSGQTDGGRRLPDLIQDTISSAIESFEETF